MTTQRNTLRRFDAYEIHGVRRYGRGNNRYCEQVDDSDAQFWSLFGHIPGQGLECIGDFKTRKRAEEMLFRIAGRTDGELAITEDEIHEFLEKQGEIAVIWSTDDVKILRPDLTDEQAWQVLERSNLLQDRGQGFSWHLIDDVAEELFPERNDGGDQ